MKIILKWAAFNAAILYLAWSSVNGDVGIGRVFIFLSWIHLLAGIVATLSKTEKRKRPVPAWLSHTLGGVLAMMLIYHGWYWMGIVWFISELFEYERYLEEAK